MKYSGPPICRLFISIIPLYVAYVLCGTLLFGHSDDENIDSTFGTADFAAKNLFAVMLGDNVLYSFQWAGVGSFVGELYMYR